MRKKMKIHGLMAGFLLSGSLTVFSGELDGNVDYLLLTRENMPTPAMIIEGCLNNLDFDPESYDSYMKKKQAAAWLPLVHLGGDIQQNRLNDYNYVDNYQVDYSYNAANSINNGQTFGGYQQTGYEDTYLVDLWVQWDLRNLLYDYDRQTVIVATANNENERHFLYAEVSQRYGNLYSLLPEDTGKKISASKASRIIENAAVLDAMSGFLISDLLRATLQAAEEQPVVIENGVDIRTEMEAEEQEQPAVVEVDDGQDDTVEKAF